MAQSPLTMLGAYGEWAADRAALGPGSLSFRDPRWKSLGPWKKAAREELARAFRPPLGTEGGPIKAADVRVHSAYELDGLAVEEVSWQLPYGPRTEAVFFKPAAAKGRLPGVLALHDHGGNKYFGRRKITRTAAAQHPLMKRHQDGYYGGVAWANELARRGFAVLVHDVSPSRAGRCWPRDSPPMPWNGSWRARGPARDDPRGPRIDDARAALRGARRRTRGRHRRLQCFAGQHETIVAKSLICAGTTWPGVTLAEDSAALSYLASRPDVDSSRLGCGGLSGGGMRSVFLAGQDDRVRCTVVVGFMTTWRDFCRNVSYTHTWMIYPSGIPGQMDFPEMLSVRAPLPSLVLSTTEDPLYTREEIERAGKDSHRGVREGRRARRLPLDPVPGPTSLTCPCRPRLSSGWRGG